jgi:hypothetical protein
MVLTRELYGALPARVGGNRLPRTILDAEAETRKHTILDNGAATSRDGTSRCPSSGPSKC